MKDDMSKKAKIDALKGIYDMAIKKMMAGKKKSKANDDDDDDDDDDDMAAMAMKPAGLTITVG